MLEYLQANAGEYLKKGMDDAISLVVDGKKYLLFYVYSDYTGLALFSCVPENVVFKPLELYQLWFWGFTL